MSRPIYCHGPIYCHSPIILSQFHIWHAFHSALFGRRFLWLFGLYAAMTYNLFQNKNIVWRTCVKGFN